ncbi:MAG: sodium:solute symporter [Acidobacterium sp.]|nr:sodium:solute symporter [Acidobacteriota bacterium]PHY11773.1 MAG: sodium:solute symporter [Acidobacterium sp.]
MAILTIGVMYAAFLLIGWLATRRHGDRSAADFIVAGRALPLWLATLTMTATWVDGGYLLGTAEGAYQSSIATGLQGGVFFGVSLILGGLFFARVMRRHAFTTLIDPFEARYGPRWAVVLSVPAMLAEMFWSAELLVALGSTFGVVLEIDLTTAILVSAVVVTLYTMAGGMWAVAYTDAFQLMLVAIGLAAALPVALGAVGGLTAAWHTYQAARPDAAVLLPPLAASGTLWTRQAIVSWWDVSIMLMLGGIPWNCYFQRVLSCRTPADAVRHSLLAGLLTIGLTIPPLLFGLVAFAYPWSPELAARLAAQPADALPLIFKHVVPPVIGLFGLAAIVGAVTSSFSASILSAGAMFSWNTCMRLLSPTMTFGRMKVVMRVTIAALGAGAVWMALEVQSVRALWFFTSDLVFVLLFPQLACALFDPRANLAGSMAAFAVSLALRVGGGEPLFGLPALVAYPEWLPFKTVAAGAGLVLLPVVSRLTWRWSAPRPLPDPAGS